MGRPRSNHAYNYFIINPDKTSQCLLCNVTKKTSHGSNLLRHLEFHHRQEYYESLAKNAEYNKISIDKDVVEKLQADSVAVNKAEQDVLESDDQSDSNDDDDESPMDNFVFLGRGRARCTICHGTIRSKRRTMRNHLKIHQEINNGVSDCMKTDGETLIDAEDSYSEVVYLDEPLLNATQVNKRPKLKRRSMPIHIKHEPKEIQRMPLPQRPQKETLTKHEEECEKFGAYIMHLLKSTPPEICAKLQMDIVALIMSEKIKIADKKAAASTPLQQYIVNVNDIDNNSSVNELSNVKEIRIEVGQNEAEATTS